ncbi:MAG: formate dehydrogenase accessory protein FdhE [Gammaproteobacteria bacterium]|nr:formate dehydrogenase accessory protein FdhE [Gammaproteobacteria bacterium]
MPDSVLAGGVPSIPEFRPTRKSVFTDRAQRLRDLADGHAMQEYLLFASALARAQAAELEVYPDTPVPDPAQLEHCQQHGLPPLSIDSAQPAGWQQGLLRLLDALNQDALPPEAVRIANELRDEDNTALERDQEHMFAGAYAEIDSGRAPFIGAALQVHWVKMALRLGERGRSAGVDFGLCPVCGSPPVVSVVRSGGAEQGLRYLVCSLCASEWHVVRVKCTSCASTKNISYLFIEGSNDAVKAECCDECKTYRKILYLDKDNHMESIADDLATLALDMLVDQKGFRRVGPNLLLSPG